MSSSSRREPSLVERSAKWRGLLFAPSPHQVPSLERSDERQPAASMYPQPMPRISHLECSRCHQHISADTPQTLCPHCTGVLYVRYDLSSAKGTAVRDRIATEAGTAPSAGMWRYRSVLPSVDP